jgi:hypothetical protein
MAGEKVNCRQCGQKIRLPGAKPAAPALAAAPPIPARAPIPVPTPAAAPAPPPPQYACSVCAQRFPVDQVYNQDGTLICKDCFATQQASVEQPEPHPYHQLEGGTDYSAQVETSTCTACGTPVDMQLAEHVGGQLMCASCAMLAAASVAGAPRSTPPVRKTIPVKKKPPYIWIAGGAAAVVVLGVVIVISRSGSSKPKVSETAPPAQPAVVPGRLVAIAPPAPAPAPVPEELNAANSMQLVELRSAALDQEGKGDLKAASATYEQMVKIGESTPNPDDHLKAQLATARAEWDSVKERLAAATPAPAPAPANTAAADPTPMPTASVSAPKPDAQPAPAPTPAANGNWEQQHSAQMKQLLHQAESQLAANNTFNAALTYQQLFQLVGNHLPDIQDADLKHQISSAAISRGKLLVQVKSSPESINLTAGTLLASGLEALNQKHWLAGVESLSDVRDLFDHNIKMVDKVRDPNYIMALHGLAVAYLSTKQTPKAGLLFEETAPLGAVVDREPTRELVINRAVTDIIQRTKAMRAAKSLKMYLEKHPAAEPDEQLLNLLGTSLFVAEQHTGAKGFLEQCAKLYDAENQRLEKTHPGQRRWGVQWLPANEVARKFAERQTQIQEYSNLAAQANAAAVESARQQEMVNSYYANGARKTSPAAAQNALNIATNLARAAAAAKAKVTVLPWLTELDPVLPPMPKGITVVAADTSDTGTGTSVFTIPSTASHDASPSSPSVSGPTGTATTPPMESAPPVREKPVHISTPRHALAFAVDKTHLITSAEVVANSRDVRMENAEGQVYSAHVIASQGALALLELEGGSGQLRYLNVAEGFTGGAVTCSAVPQENVFGPQPVVISGQAIIPAQGEWTVNLSEHPRLAGSPLFNPQGQIVGVVVAKRDDAKTRLPVVGISELRQFLTAHSALPAAPSGNSNPMTVFEVTVQEN